MTLQSTLQSNLVTSEGTRYPAKIRVSGGIISIIYEIVRPETRHRPKRELTFSSESFVQDNLFEDASGRCFIKIYNSRKDIFKISRKAKFFLLKSLKNWYFIDQKAKSSSGRLLLKIILIFKLKFVSIKAYGAWCKG